MFLFFMATGYLLHTMGKVDILTYHSVELEITVNGLTILVAVLIATVVAATVWNTLSLKRKSIDKSQLTLTFEADNGSGSLRLRVINRKWVEVFLTQTNFKHKLEVSIGAYFPYDMREEVYKRLSSSENFYLPGSAVKEDQTQINDLQGIEVGDDMTFLIVSRSNHDDNVMVIFSKKQVSEIAHWLNSLT